MAETDGDKDAPQQGYIPRPPSKEDVDRVSGQQGMITDEWADSSSTPPKPEGGPEEEKTEGQPS